MHRFTVFNLVGRSGSLDSISTEDLSLISIMHQGVKINFGRSMIGKIRFVFEKAVKQKLLSIKRAICLPFGKFIYRILVTFGVSTQGLQVLLTTEGPLDHVLLLCAHFCHYQENWVHASSLSRQQLAYARKETMAIARRFAPFASPPSSPIVVVAAVAVEIPSRPLIDEVLEDEFRIEEDIASAQDRISLAMSMDNIFLFSA